MKNLILKNEKGMTLVELLVSVSIFAVVMTMTVSFFITLQKMQMTYRDAAALNQEGRVVSEIFSRQIREAEKVVIVDNNSDGSICSDADATAARTAATSGGYDLGIPLDYIAIKKKITDSYVLVFACWHDSDVAPRYLMTGVVAKDFSTIVPKDDFYLPFISSGQVTVKNLKITHNNPATYPKTLKYDIEVNRFNDWLYTGINPVGMGEIIHFPGYLVMKNEL